MHMKLNFRRLLAMFLSIVMVAGMLPAAVFAEDGVETTTYVAKVGNTECADADALISALNAASGEVTVEIYDKITIAELGLNNANITKLSFVGKDTDAEICVDGVSYIDVRYTSYPIEYTSLILSHINAGQNIDGFLPQYFSTYNGGNVTYTSCTFPNGVTACGSTANTTYTFNQCTFNNTTSGLYSLWVYGNSTNVVINGGTFSGVRGIKMYSEGSDDFSTLAVTNATFSNTINEKHAIVMTKGESITLTGNTFNNTTGIVEVDDAYASTIDGKIVTINGTEYTVDSDSLELEKAAPEVVVVTTYEELIAALAGDVKSIKMMNNITAAATQSSSYGKAGIVINAGYVLDGNGYTLTINDANATWDCAIAMRGGEVKNLTIAGAMRGVFMPGADGDVVIDNCEFKNVVYTFNSDAGSKDYTVTIKNTTLNGWTSFSPVHKSVTFENCSFGEGSGYAFCRPYQATTFTNCSFDEGFKLDTAEAGDNNLAFNECTYNGTALSAKNNAMFYNGGSVVINGVSTDVTPPTGSNSYAYTTEVGGNVRVWGEGGGNAKESYVLKLYSGETLIATTKLNNVGGIIDGDVYVTWHFFYPESTDAYWTTTWEEGHPKAEAQPTKVELIIDGTVVATTDAMMSGADGVNPVVWADLGGVKKIVTGLSGEGTAEDPYLINNLDDLIWFRNNVNTYTQDGSNQYKGKYVKLMADINLAGINWEPIGKNTQGDHQNFLGTFDGGDHTISNLYINADGDHLGFFARVGSYDEGITPTVKNITFNNVDVSSNTTTGHGGSYVAGVIANAGGNSVVSGVKVTGNVYVAGYGYVGGIVGHGYPDIDNCSVVADEGSYIHCHYWCCGGIIGYAGEGGTPITDSSVSGVDIWSAYGAAAAVAGLLQDGNKLENVSASNVEITSNSDYCMGYIAGNGECSTMTNITANNVTVTAKGNPITSTDAVASVNGTIYFDLQTALDAAAAGTGNITVEILRDVNLNGVDWNPVTVSANGYPVVTVNGNNKTITGLNDMLFAGTWAGKSGLIINDLTIKDSNIVNDADDAAGTVGVGAFIGFPQASETITLINCHLVNSIVKGGHWTGGLIGYAAGYAGNDGPVFMNLTIKDCSVTGSTITGKGSAGGVIGHGSGNGWTKVVIENTTVSGNNITSTGSSTNKAGSVMGTIGAAGQPTTVNGVTLTGGAFVSATVSGNTVTSAGTTITTIYGRQGTVGGTLEVTGGSYDKYPIEENVSYAAPAEGYVIEESADGTYGLVIAPTSKTYNVSTKADLDAAIAAAAAGDTILLTADIDYGTDQLKLEKAITLDLGGKTLTTRNAWGGMSVKNNPTIKNGTIVHASNTAAIKVWNATAFEDLVIDVQGKGDANKTIGGIVLQEGSTTHVGSIKNVTIKGVALTNGIETYNCGNATEPVIGSMENVTIDAKSVGLNISAPCGTATNCSIKGGINGIEIWIKGTYSATLNLVNCNVVGGVFAHDEFNSNPSIVNNGTLKLTADTATTGASEDAITLTIARAEKVEGILKNVMDNAQAKVNDTYYATLAEAIAAAQNGDIITLLYAEGDAAIAMNGAVYGKTVTITGTATVDWSKGNLFVGRGGEGDGKVIFDGANITSSVKKNPASTGIHVSGGKGSDANTNYGTLEIKNSTIELDYLINRNATIVDGNSTLTVYGGCWTHGRDASESVSGTDETATLTIGAGSTVIVINENGMGVGGEGKGEMIVDGTYNANVLNVSAKGIVKIGGAVAITGTATNNGSIVLTDKAATLTSTECGSVTTTLNGCKVVYENGVYKVAHKAIEVTYADGTVEYFDDILEAVPYKTDYDKLQGATIKLLADVTGKGIRFMETDMVLDLNEYTYTINNATGSSGTNTSGFQIREDASKTTIKNGTIKVAEPDDMVENTSVIWMFNSYSADFTVEDVTIDCTNMAWGYGENCYVHVSRPGDNTNFIGTTKVINFNSEVAGNAINVGGTMTIGEDVVPGGAVELDDGATLTAPEGLNVTTTVDGYEVKYTDGKYTVVEEVKPSATIVASEASLLYRDIVQLRYKFKITGAFTNAYLLIWDNEADAIARNMDTAVVKQLTSNGQFYVGDSDGIAAKNMGDLQYIVGKVETETGDAFTKTIAYSPLRYAEYFKDDDTEGPLVNALMGYGAAAQIYFNYKTDSLMSEGFNVPAYDATKLLDKTQKVTNNGNYGITAKEVSLVFAGAVEYKFKFTIDSAAVGNDWKMSYCFTDGTSGIVELVKNGNFYTATVPGRGAKDMDQVVSIVVYYGDTAPSDAVTVSYNGHDYVRSIIGLANQPEAMKNLAKQFLMYIIAADARLGGN